MLRAFVLLLLLLNGGFYAWEQGWLLAYGLGPTPQREPHRLAQQIQPEAIALISEQAAITQPVPMQPPNTVCLQSGVLDAARVAALRTVLAASWPASAWALDPAATPERWIVYMGQYANAAELDKKRTQLATLRLTFEPLRNPTLAPGLSLGAFTSQAQANTALEALALRGVRTARVLQELPAGQGYRLHLPAVDDTLEKQLSPVRAALAGQALVPCARANP